MVRFGSPDLPQNRTRPVYDHPGHFSDFVPRLPPLARRNRPCIMIRNAGRPLESDDEPPGPPFPFATLRHCTMAESATPSKRERDPDLPPMGRLNSLHCPRAPQTIAEARLEEGVLTDLALKAANGINYFTEEWLCDRLFISPALAIALTT